MLLRAKPFPVPFLIPSSFYSHLPAYEDGRVCSETLAYKLQTPGNYTKESLRPFCSFTTARGLVYIIFSSVGVKVKLVK